MSAKIFVAAVLAVAAIPAQAVTFFSVGGAPDPGFATYETPIVTFDAPNMAGVIQTNQGSVTVQSGSNGIGAAPAGDATQYLSVQTDGSATFDFRDYFATRTRQARSLSVYVGSVDQYNHIDILDRNLAVIATINGADLPGSNGDQGAAITNRRLFVNFLPTEDVGGLTFRSNGIAFEFDSIAASSAVYQTGGATVLPSLPAAGNVPEPTTWAMFILGIGLVGFAVRRRRRATFATVIVTD